MDCTDTTDSSGTTERVAGSIALLPRSETSRVSKACPEPGSSERNSTAPIEAVWYRAGPAGPWFRAKRESDIVELHTARVIAPPCRVAVLLSKVVWKVLPPAQAASKIAPPLPAEFR